MPILVSESGILKLESWKTDLRRMLLLMNVGISTKEWHPTVCKYWKNNKKLCKRDEACQYLNRNNQSMKATKSKESKVNAINTECVEMQIEVLDSMDENVVEKANEVLKMGELETLIASKDQTIKELRETEVNLKLENQTNKEQAEKLQRIAVNMYKELSELKSKKWKSESESEGRE